MAEQLEKGMLPLWNPWSYFGIPLLGNFQTGLFHPFSVLFHIFPFTTALGPFLWLLHASAALWTYLWLRRLRAGRWPSAAGALLFSMSGYLVAHAQYLNLAAALVIMPALFLFTGRWALGAVASALGLLAGYPTNWAALTGAWAVLGWVWTPGWKSPRSAALATAAALALAAPALLPGLELSRVSGRSSGVEEDERLRNSLTPAELLTLAHPELARWADLRRQPVLPAQERVVWTFDGATSTFTFATDGRVDLLSDPGGLRYVPHKAGYLGTVGAAIAGIGLVLLCAARPWAGAAAALFSALSALLLLGPNTQASSWLWHNVSALSFIRGPARLSYLLLVAAVPLAALALDRLGRTRYRVAAAALTLAAAVELFQAGWGFYPSLPKEYYADRGPLVDFLQKNLGPAERYHQIPGLEPWPNLWRESEDPRWEEFKRVSYLTYRDKLYGIANGVFHLAASSGDYEPLVPAASERAAAALEKTKEPAAVARRMRWTGNRFLFDRRHRLDGSAEFDYKGTYLWRTYETKKKASRAWLLPPGAELPDSFADAPEPFGVPVDLVNPREDRVVANGEGGGTLFLSEPHYPGWQAYVNGAATPLRRALEAFSAVETPQGPWTLLLTFRPASWTLGLWLGLLAWAAAAAYGARRLGKVIESVTTFH